MRRSSVCVLALFALMAWLGFPLLQPSSSSSVDYSIVAQSSDHGRAFVVRDATIEPGGRIGWHWHRGTVIAAVKEGTLYHYGSDCSLDGIYRAGESFVEPSGADHVHDGRNLGATPVVLEVMYIIPEGTPLADAREAPPGCVT
ncbi:hypothetical protein BST16_18425 [Mycobacterium asiaticum DSM 44297]|nr:hypothetical protein BST16_18425 [Mycobacterium asiaticum DSM 44297]